jgi:diphthamide synthase (EF-2-diphthine--ammonia ligase)
MRELIAKAQKAGVAAMGFGDLYLEDIRKYREAQLSNTGIEPLFPLWNRPTDLLAKEIISSGIAAVLTCIDPKKLPASFAGRRFDSQTIADFPGLVDPCGENGEFHTFVYASPNFKSPISIEVGETVERDGFVFADVLPVDGIQSVESHSNSHEI